MKKAALLAVVCAAVFVAGCGSSSKTTPTTSAATTSSTPATTSSGSGSSATSSGMTVGSKGTMGPPPGGSPYDLRNNTVLKHLLHMVDVAVAAKGNTNVRGVCKAISSTQAECGVEFTTSQGQVVKALYTLTVNLQTGQYTVSNVRPLH